MSIKVVRIDDRLIHGQIVQGWLKTVQVDKILVVSDEVAADEMQQILMSMAVPSSVKLIIRNVKEAAYDLSNGVYDNDKLMILFSNPQDIVRISNDGIKFQSVNVGGMHYSHGKKQLLTNLSVDKNDVESFLKLLSFGVELEARALPQDERYNIIFDIQKEAEILGLSAH